MTIRSSTSGAEPRFGSRPKPDRKRRASLATAFALLVGAVLAAPGPASAHEEAVLEASASAVAAGSSLELVGSEFTADEEFRLRLLGALEEHDLGTVTADSAGTFRLELELPAEARQGRYQLVALAPDGDEVARLDLNVTPAASAGGEEAGPAAEKAGGAGEASSGGRDEARADEMEIERSRSGVEWAALLLVVGLSGGLGARLLRGAGRIREES